MNISFPAVRSLFFFLALFCLQGCVKTIPDTTDPNGNGTIPGTPTVTAVGTPVGDPVSKTIGVTGGSLISADGNAELIFPSGALTGNTDISIQAVTNTAPNGVANAYRFLPEGVNFLQPVTVKFHYSPEDLAATLGDLMGIAFQDSAGGWWRVNDFTNDTVHKIISAPIKHFSVWTPFTMLNIYPRYAIVSVNKSISIEVQVIDGDDDLADLKDNVKPIVRSKNTKSIVWAANGVTNGNSNLGTITGTSFYAADFHAPSKVPSGSQNPVNITATLDLSFKYKGETITKPSLISSLRIVDAEVYLMEVRILDTVVNTAPDYIIVWDSASLKVTIKDDHVTISEITNFAPKANPSQIVYPHDATHYVPDPVGEINIVSGKGEVAPYIIGSPEEGRLLALSFVQSGTLYPKTHYTAENNYEDYSGGYAIAGYPTGWAFQILTAGEVGMSSPPFVGVLDKVLDVKLTLLKN